MNYHFITVYLTFILLYLIFIIITIYYIYYIIILLSFILDKIYLATQHDTQKDSAKTETSATTLASQKPLKTIFQKLNPCI